MCQRSKKRLPNQMCILAMNDSIYALIQRSVSLDWLINLVLCSLLKHPLDRICKSFKNRLPVSVLSSAADWNWNWNSKIPPLNILWNYKITFLQWFPLAIKLDIKVENFLPKRTTPFSSFTLASAVPVTPVSTRRKIVLHFSVLRIEKILKSS